MSTDTQLTAENFKGEEMMIDIESIIASPELQQRDLSDSYDAKNYKTAVSDVVEAIAKKEDIERVLIVKIPDGTNRVSDGQPIKGGLYLVEGFRRMAGYKAAGKSKIPAIVRAGTWEDAMDVSTSANIKNLALPRKPADKRKAAESCLINHFDWSDRRIADHVRVSAELVAKVRPIAEKYLNTFAKDKPNGKPVDTKTRVGKSGKRQAATKKTAKKKAKAVVDWSGWETAYGNLVRFVDHVGSMTMTEEELKKKETDYQKAHACLKAFGFRMRAWGAKRPKVIA